jgi:hypothetical protein
MASISILALCVHSHETLGLGTVPPFQGKGLLGCEMYGFWGLQRVGTYLQLLGHKILSRAILIQWE